MKNPPASAGNMETSHCRDFSYCRAWALGRVDFKSWGTRVQELQLIGSRDHVLQLLKPARPRVHAL